MPRVSLDKAVEDRQVCLVQSSSDPSVFYELRFVPGFGWTCSCPGFGYRQQCKHADKKTAETGTGHGHQEAGEDG